ncbi:hypothetical protein BDF22DRAFT_742823 [Syncephalis plumigaleata]|nr:hypothetical protein BDF22DRAFT_742823 [Syncephalis plumigaleata]
MAFGRLIISVMLIARLDVSPIYYEMAWHFPLVSGISAMTIYCVDVIRCIPPRISPNWIPNYETIRNIHRSAIAVLYTIIMTLAAILGYFLEQRSHELSVIIYTVIYYIYTVIGLMLVLVYLVFGSRLVTLTIRQLNLYEANTRCDEAIQGKVISLQHSILRMRVQNAGGIITVAMCTICVFVSATFPSLIARHPIVNQILCVIYNILHPTFFLMIISIVTKFESMTIFESRRASHIQTNINNHSSYHESTEDAYYKDLIISIPSEPVILELDPIDVAPAYEQSNMAHQAISHELASVQHHNNYRM